MDHHPQEDMTAGPAMVHPAIITLSAALGIPVDLLAPGEEQITRTERKDGRYWRVEWMGFEGGVDHLIEIRPRDVQGIRRIISAEGVLEINLHPGRDLPETLVAALLGRTLGDLLDIQGPGADLRITSVKPCIMGADGVTPLEIRFETAEYVRLEPSSRI